MNAIENTTTSLVFQRCLQASNHQPPILIELHAWTKVVPRTRHSQQGQSPEHPFQPFAYFHAIELKVVEGTASNCQVFFAPSIGRSFRVWLDRTCEVCLLASSCSSGDRKNENTNVKLERYTRLHIICTWYPVCTRA